MSQPVEQIVREGCTGLPPLSARLEPWHLKVARNPSAVREWVEVRGSPIHLLHTPPFLRNIKKLESVAEQRGIPLRVFFARKANKCLAFVEEARQQNRGVDVASEIELLQALECGCLPENLIVTAAVKSQSLCDLVARHRVVTALDNADEVRRLAQSARRCDEPLPVALRVSGFQVGDNKLFSRFGFDLHQVRGAVDELWSQPAIRERLSLSGLHFHLDGYDADERVRAIDQCLALIDDLRLQKHPIRFLDVGGGAPTSYLDDARQWEQFWEELRRALGGEREPITYQNYGFGLVVHEGQQLGKARVYPYYQSPTRDQWLGQILDSPCDGDVSIVEGIRRRQIELRCEPGRSILDGCGMTVARVEYRKQHPQGHWLIGLAMNRTQCRTTSEDFLVDPLLLSQRPEGEPIDGYLTGSYCMESEVLTWRKLRFPRGVEVGDLIAFPNTAGYLMHFIESRSHWFPLAKNLVINDIDELQVTPDAVDSESGITR